MRLRLSSLPLIARWIYFLRVPILTGLGFLVICVLAFTGARSHLGGAFDIESYVGIFWVSLIAFLFASVVAIAWRRVLCYGPERFFGGNPCTSFPEGLSLLGYILLIAAIAIPIVGFALYGSTRGSSLEGCGDPVMYDCSPLSLGPAILWAALGFVAYLACIVIVREVSRRGVDLALGRRTALVLFLLTLAVYIGVGFTDFVRVTRGAPTIIPTLGYVLLLFTLLCWGLSVLAFRLDRYRIPVLLPLVVAVCIISLLPSVKSDYYYPVMKPASPTEPIPESDLPKEKPPQKKIIVVAATGGGIQSATWTARVLTGLEEECRESCNRSFDGSIRLISAVSGGSVGTMYFVNEYKGGHLPGKESDPKALKKIVHRAQSSSLDYAVWGLLYPDFVRLFFPFFFKLPWDRGWALEQAWLSQQETQTPDEGLEDKLSEWRNDARAGVRPAVIFNTTVTETGHRLPLTTTEPIKGRLEHKDLLAPGEKETDVSVATAVRLSAAWPYVSPAARADVDGTAPHLVDGGYYDNYGVASLVEWLDDELEREAKEDTPDIEKVLVVQISAAGAPCPTGETPAGEDQATEAKTGKEGTTPTAGTQTNDRNINDQIKKKRGWFYQAYAPPWTALNVRGPAQRGSNEAALDLLRDKWDKKKENEHEDVDIVEANFTFDGTNPPTSWHLTDKQKADIERSWKAELDKECNNDQGWDKVQSFLGKKPDTGQPGNGGAEAQTPKDWPAPPVNIAHRGGRYLAPENTIVGFQEGLVRAGVDVLEFDVHLTADGHLVVIHDDTVDRTTGGSGRVRDMTLEEIQRLDAGYYFPDEDSKTHPYRGQGVTIPTLQEVYRAFPETPVNIEIKEDQPGIEQKLWKEIEATGAEDRTLVVSGKMSVIDRFREVSGKQVTTGASVREMGSFILWSHLFPGSLLHPPYKALQVPKEVVTSGFVQAAHRSGLRVDPWTVNTEAGMRRVLGYGVDGIMTDHPDVLNRVLEGEDKDG